MSESKGQKGIRQCMNCASGSQDKLREYKFQNLKRIKRLETFTAT